MGYIKYYKIDLNYEYIAKISNIKNNIIKFVGAQNASDIFAIYAELADNLNIQANTITYVGKTDGSGANGAVYVSNSENVNVDVLSILIVSLC